MIVPVVKGHMISIEGDYVYKEMRTIEILKAFRIFCKNIDIPLYPA